MMPSSNGGAEVHGITAADLASMSERLDVIADDIVILTRERDEAQAEVERLRVEDECPHLAESGDEGPVGDLYGGLMTVVRWRCDGCARVRYDDQSLDRLRALFAATTERLAAVLTEATP